MALRDVNMLAVSEDRDKTVKLIRLTNIGKKLLPGEIKDGVD